MCMYTNQLEPKIAEKNILVTKRTGVPGFPVFTQSIAQNFWYLKYVKYKASISCRTLKVRNFVGIEAVEEGFHSYINTDRKAPNFPRSIWSKTTYFIIPKGAEYYEGADNSTNTDEENITVRVSNQIIYIGKRNWFNRLIAKIFYGV